METPEEIISELKALTGWDDIQLVNGSYVITFYHHNLKFIKGIKGSAYSYTLVDDAFDGIPISFLVKFFNEDNDDNYYQYWTLNRQLHRMDAPAKISYNPFNRMYKQEWFFNGLPHREILPSTTEYVGYVIEETDYGTVEHWTRSDMDWKLYGQSPIKSPSRGYTMDGIRHRNKKRELHNVDGSAVYMDDATLEWNYKVGADGIHPYQMRIQALYENYNNGKFVGRKAGGIDIIWARGDDTTVVNDSFDELIHKTYFDKVSLWGGDFYGDAGTSFAITTDLLRVSRDED